MPGHRPSGQCEKFRDTHTHTHTTKHTRTNNAKGLDFEWPMCGNTILHHTDVQTHGRDLEGTWRPGSDEASATVPAYAHADKGGSELCETTCAPKDGMS